MTRFLARLAAAGLAALAIGGGAAGVAEKEDRALAATRQLLTEANQAVASNSDAALRSAIDRAFEFGIWERFLVENRADQFTPEQRQRFRQLLPGYLAWLYRDQFDRGLGAPELGGARPARNDVLVSATFERANGRDLPVDWRLREVPGEGPQVIDVMVGGTSFLLLKRDEFTSIIDRQGVDALLAHMQERSV